MQLVELEKWAIRFDPEVTEDVYALIETGGAERCGCEECFNFACVRHLVYSPELLELLERLGIDPLLESGVARLGRTDAGLHVYSGWFHLVGEIASGPPTPVAACGDEVALSLVRLDGDLSLGFSIDRSRAPEAFWGLPVVQLEFAAPVPWVSNAPEPT